MDIIQFGQIWNKNRKLSQFWQSGQPIKFWLWVFWRKNDQIFLKNGFFLILSPVCKTKWRNTLSRLLCFFSQFNVADSVDCLLSVNWFFPKCFSQQFRPFFSFPFEARNLNSLTSRIWMLSISDIHFPQRRTNFANWSQKQSVFWVVLKKLSRDKLTQLCFWSQ